jgi:hypothetical protein
MKVLQKIVNWYKKRPVTIRAAIIAGFFTIGPGMIAAIVALTQPGPDSRASLVDVGFIKGLIFPKVDIRIRNTGEKVAVLKRVIIHVERVWKLEPTWMYASALEPTKNYDVNLPSKEPPYEVNLSISQTVPPNDADRFTISMGRSDLKEIDAGYVYLFDMEILYDEDDKKISTPKLLFLTDAHGGYGFDEEAMSRLPEIKSEEVNRLVKDESLFDFRKFIESRQQETLTEEVFIEIIKELLEIKKAVTVNKQALSEIERIDGVRNEELREVIDLYSPKAIKQN